MNRAKSIYWVYTMINLDILLPHTTKKKMKFRIFVQRIIETIIRTHIKIDYYGISKI